MQRAIVIGATSGIGKGLAGKLAEQGFRLGITGRRSELLDQLKSEKPNSYIIKAFDVGDTKDSIKKLDELVAELGGLELLIICAGTGDINKELEFATEKCAIDTNVSGFTCIADWAYQYFEKQQYGQLVALSSIGGLRGSREAPAYNASKAYQINYLEGLRQKARQERIPIVITDIRPGLVDTDMAKGEGLFWVMPVEKTVRQILRAIQKKRKVAYVTKRWRFIACLLKLAPRGIYDRL